MDISKPTVWNLFSKPVRYEAPQELQRPYVWNQEDQWEPLWEDVRHIAERHLGGNNSAEHFCGTLVLQQRLHGGGAVEVREVIDGQQRLTTLQLLLQAASEACADLGFDKISGDFDLLIRNDQRFWGDDDANQWKTWPLDQDQPAFVTAMSPLTGDSKEQEGQALYEGKVYFREAIVKWLSGNAAAGDARAVVLHKAISSSLKFVEIDLTETDDPYVIFETLNSRGTPLLQWDRLKSRLANMTHQGLLGSDGAGLEAVSVVESPDLADWWREEIGSGKNVRPRVDQFLFQWLTTLYPGEIRNGREYREFAKRVDASSLGEVEGLATSLNMTVRAYQELTLNTGDQFWKRFVANLETVGAQTLMPVFLWIRTHATDENAIVKALLALESLLVRRMIGRYSTRENNKLAYALISEMASAPQSFDTAVVDYLKEPPGSSTHWPTNDELRTKFVEQPVYGLISQARLRMVLETLEAEMRSPLAEPVPVPTGLTIEHIMPRQWRSHWPIQEDDPVARQHAEQGRERVIHTFGNLTLHSAKLGTAALHHDFETKKALYKQHSKLFLTDAVVRRSAWNEETIAERGAQLAEIAIRVWPGPEDF